ncbi:hypothetical protein [Virgibacillus sp. SK37]|uniref:hypothetical protein n=1 Tax=Virgibacillus sp. SK37 TaxID=403957 RepID=UPI0004D1A2D7|nr:hypothetical protein [Virgibacillus sp. SK37]AIF45132.1 hypothetical protein X953_01825 [Virgibacillus sp. SK37]
MKSNYKSMNEQTTQIVSEEMTLKEKMNYLTIQSRNNFEYVPIFMQVNPHLNNKDVKYFVENDEAVRGCLLYDSNLYSKQDGDWGRSRQIFITKEGSFLYIDTIKEAYFCQKCNKEHYRLNHHISAKGYFNLREMLVVYNTLSRKLNKKPLFNDNPPMLSE